MSGADKLFDEFAPAYREALENAIAPSGERREYFAEGRVAWLKRCLGEIAESPNRVLDFGCGDGGTAPLLLAALNANSVLGVDVSPKSLELARKNYANAQIAFASPQELPEKDGFDLAYCNGVFHHIPKEQRVDALRFVHASLRTGGIFSLWENSPWSPATHYVMSRCAFDRDAVMLTPPESRGLLEETGFTILRTDFRFIFPRALQFLRKLEDMVYRLPLGTQYQILCRKIN